MPAAESGGRPSGGRRHVPLARTFSRARWGEYDQLLRDAVGCGYTAVSLEDWVIDGFRADGPVLILRHDVDEHPRASLAMADVEARQGVRSTWYFRWRTADAAVIAELRDGGSDVGLHYETLSRMALAAGARDEAAVLPLVDESRELLRHEIAAFSSRFGPIRSVCPHGDTRVPFVSNGVLLSGQDLSDYGISFDGKASMRRSGLSYWLTDRSVTAGRWRDGVDPRELMSRGVSPLLCVTHPNNWASGPSLWAARARRLSDTPPL